MTTDIQEAAGPDRHAGVDVGDDQALGLGTFERLREHAAVGPDDGRVAAAGGVHEHRLAGAHGFDALGAEHGGGVEDERLRFDRVRLREVLAALRPR